MAYPMHVLTEQDAGMESLPPSVNDLRDGDSPRKILHRKAVHLLVHFSQDGVRGNVGLALLEAFIW